MPKIISIHISVRGLALLSAALATVWFVITFGQLVMILFLAALLATAIDPLVDHMQARHVPRPIGILAIYTLLLGALVAVGGLLTPVLIAEVEQLSATVAATTPQVVTAPQQWLRALAPQLTAGLTFADVGQRLSGDLATALGHVGGLLVAWGRALTTLAVNVLLVLVIGFFLSADAQFGERLVTRLVPRDSRATARTLLTRIGQRLGHWVRAQLLVGALFGLLFGSGLALLGVPYALSLGVAGAVLELIPYLGGAIVTIVAMLIALTISPWRALGVLVLELVIANVESHVIYPKLVGGLVGLHPLTIIIALVIGAERGGVAGALLAVPVAVVLQVLLDYFYPAAGAPPLTQAERATRPESVAALPAREA